MQNNPQYDKMAEKNAPGREKENRPQENQQHNQQGKQDSKRPVEPQHGERRRTAHPDLRSSDAFQLSDWPGVETYSANSVTITEVSSGLSPHFSLTH